MEKWKVRNYTDFISVIFRVPSNWNNNGYHYLKSENKYNEINLDYSKLYKPNFY